MNEIINTQKQTMSSREIAQLTGKRHDHVLRDCDNLNASYIKLGLPKIGEGYYTHPSTGDQQHRQYLLTKIQTMDLMTGYSVELRIKVNRRWEELESHALESNQYKIPKTFAEALRIAAEQAEENEKLQLEISEKERIIEEQSPSVTFAKTVEASKTTILIRELAKFLRQNGIDIGQNRLYEWMRENGYLIKSGSDYNTPTQKAMDMGLFEITERTIATSEKVVVSKTTKVTGKGQVYFINKFLTLPMVMKRHEIKALPSSRVQ